MGGRPFFLPLSPLELLDPAALSPFSTVLDIAVRKVFGPASWVDTQIHCWIRSGWSSGRRRAAHRLGGLHSQSLAHGPPPL